MDMKEYQALARRTAKPLPHQEAMNHGVMGIVSDWGEVVTHVKAHVVYGKPVTKGEIRLELGDVCWFIAYLFDVIDVEIEHVNQHAIPGYPPAMSEALVFVSLQGARYIGKIADIVSAVSDMPEELYPNIAYNLSMLWHCVFNMATMSGLTMEEIWEHNIEKLRQRYPDKYSDADAIARADENMTALNVAAKARAMGEGTY